MTQTRIPASLTPQSHALFTAGLTFNTALPSGTVKLRTAPPKRFELILNGDLLSGASGYGVTTTAFASPAPSGRPLGVEALATPTPDSRAEANRLALLELDKLVPDLTLLEKYSGGGGIGESFDEFYTPRALVEFMWAMAGKLNTGDRVLDPACGTGHLLALAPERLLLTGVELRRESARVAAALLPHAHISNLPFEAFHTGCAEAPYDAVLVNPPYGPRLKRNLDAPEFTQAEDYFTVRSIERTTHLSGMTVMLIPAAMTGNPSDVTWRRELLLRGLPILALIVPDSAFKASGAGVTTALMSVRRHDVGVHEALNLLNDKQLGNVLSEYAPDYNLRPSSWLAGVSLFTTKGAGEERTYDLQVTSLSGYRGLKPGRYGTVGCPGNIETSPGRVSAIRSRTNDLLKEKPVTLPAVLSTIDVLYGTELAEQCRQAARKATAHTIPLGARSPDGQYVLTEKGWEIMNDIDRPEITDALMVASSLARLLGLQNRPVQDAGEISNLRRTAETLSSRYLKRHGTYPERPLKRLTGRFPSLALLLANIQNGELRLPEKAAVKLALKGAPLEVARQLADLTQLNENSLTKHTQLSQTEAEKLLETHFCYDGEDLWLSPGLYYSGNALEKSAAARTLSLSMHGSRRRALLSQADSFLSRMTPARMTELDLSPREKVVSSAVLSAWVNDFLSSYTRHRGEMIRALSVTREEGAVKLTLRATLDRNENLAARKTFDSLEARRLSEYLNFATPLERVAGASHLNPEEYRAERAAAMQEALEYEGRVKRHFLAWLPGSEYAHEMLDAYNHARRANLVAVGDTAPVNLPGYMGPVHHPYQCADIRAFAHSTGKVAGWGVGLGKTNLGLCVIALLRVQGLASRPVVVCPAAILGRWVQEVKSCFPDWTVVAVGMSPVLDREGNQVYKTRKDGSFMIRDGRRIERWAPDSPQTKKLKVAQVSAGNVDLTIMSRDTYKNLPLSDASREYLTAHDVQVTSRIEAKNGFDPVNKRSRHDVLKRRAAAISRVSSRLKVTHEHEMNFETLAIDCVIYDEAHAYNHAHGLPTLFGGESPRFLGSGAESDRAIDALYKARLVRQQGGRTYALSASWVHNSPLDCLAMMHLVSDNLHRYGLDTSEAMLEKYIEVEPRILTSLDGEIDLKPAVVGFRFLKELRSVLFSSIRVRRPGDAEVVTATGPLKVPTVIHRELTFSMTAEQNERYSEIKALLRLPREGLTPEEKKERHPFKILWQLRKLSVDSHLIGVAGRNPRFEMIAQEALRVRARGEKTLIFLSIGESQGSFARLKDTLIQAGYPADEIETVSANTHKNSLTRQDLEDNFNYGDLTLVLSSEVLSEGVNLNIGTGAVLHADLRWNFQSLAQRIGRAARQGNVLDQVESVYFLMKGGFDLIAYSILKGKQNWENQLTDMDVDAITSGGNEFSTEELALMLSDTPEETRLAIEERKVTLTEQTGRARLSRQLSDLQTALWYRENHASLMKTASGRRDGWTAHDHFRISDANRRAWRARSAVLQEVEGGFALGRLIDSRQHLNWWCSLPLHNGMRFTLGQERYEVTASATQNDEIRAVNSEGDARSILVREIAKNGRDFQPTDDAYAYRDAPTELKAEEIQIHFSAAAAVTAHNGRAVNPKPKDDTNVISVAVLGKRPYIVSGYSESALRQLILKGYTVIHFLTQSQKDGVHIMKVSVINPDLQGLQKTTLALGTSGLRKRLQEVLTYALAS